MGEPTKFCKDCRWRRGWRRDFWRCGRPEALKFNSNYLATADVPKQTYCSSMRGNGDQCGPDAKLWERRS